GSFLSYPIQRAMKVSKATQQTLHTHTTTTTTITGGQNGRSDDLTREATAGGANQDRHRHHHELQPAAQLSQLPQRHLICTFIGDCTLIRSYDIFY
ncbi:unnamed protein product, partial [Musa acuminata var. zebrina]